MFVSANRTLVQVVATQTIGRAKASDPLLDCLLLCLETRKLAIALRQRAEEVADERADRAAALGGAHARLVIDVVGDGDRDVLHPRDASTGSQFLCYTAQKYRGQR